MLMEESEPSIGVESTTEWQINDILYDGQERYLQPLKFSDHVAKLAHKVKWHGLCGSDEANSLRVKESEEIKKEAKEDQKDKEDSQKAESTGEVTGKWDTVARELTIALNELNVLRDVIKLLQQRRYLMLDRVAPGQDELPPTPIVSQRNMMLTSKKKSLQQAQSVLGSLLDKLKAERSEAQNINHVGSFQMELMRMRKRWRLKRSGNLTLGDVAFRTVGARFRPEATFEVHKCTTEQEGGPPGVTCPIRIVLPKDLEKNVGLKVTIIKDNQFLASYVPHPNQLSPGPLDSSVKRRGWEDRLVRAQRTLLHRDIFVLLQREASMPESILCSVKSSAMSIQLSHNSILKLELVESEHNSDHEIQELDRVGNLNFESDFDNSYATSASSTPTPLAGNAAFCLYDTLLYLYCKLFSGAPPTVPNLGLCRPFSAPSSSLFNQKKRLRLAGPSGTAVDALAQPTVPRIDAASSLLQRIVNLARHVLLVRSVQAALDDFIGGVHDVLVHCRWIRDPSVSSVQAQGLIYVVNPGYELFQASRFNASYLNVEVGVDDIQLMSRDGEVIQLGGDVDTLLDTLRSMIVSNQMTILQNIAKHVEWQAQASQLQHALPDGTLCPILLLGHTNGKRSLSIKYPVGGKPEVKVQMECTPSVKGETNAIGRGGCESDLLEDAPQSENLLTDYRSVVVEDLFGSTFLQKMEYLITTLS